MGTLSEKAGFLIVANFVKYAVGFILPMVLVRMLSQEDYGTYQQLNLISMASIGILTLGLPTSVYYFYQHAARNRVSALIVQTSAMLGLTALLASVFIFLFADPLARYLNNPSMAGVLALYALAVGCMIASEHSASFMIAQDRYRTAVAFETGEILIRVLLLLTPLWLGYGLFGLVVGIVIYACLRVLIRSAYLIFRSDLNWSGWSSHLFPMEQLGYSIPLALVSLTSLIGSVYNRGILATSFSPAEFAIYAVGALEIPLDSIFQASVANVLRASLPALAREGRFDEVARILREAVRKLSIIVLPSFVFLFGHAHEFITVLFTERYADSVPVFRIYLLLMPLQMLILSPIPQVFGRTRLNLYIVLSTTAVRLVLSYVLLKMVGFYGPAIAAIATEWLQVIIFFVVAMSLTRSSLVALLPLGPMARVIGASLLSLLAAQVAHDLTSSGLLNLFLSGVVFSVAFLALAIPMGVLSPSDRMLVRRWVMKAVGQKTPG